MLRRVRDGTLHQCPSCKYRPLKCECGLFGVSPCFWLGSIYELEDHFRNEHPNHIGKMQNDVEFSVTIDMDRAQKDIQLIMLENEFYYYKHSLDLITKKFYVVVQMIRTEQQANYYYYNYKLMNGDRVINIMGICHSDSMSDSVIFEKETCIALSLKTLANYISDGRLRFKIEITSIS